ncbi:sensor histidine kinase [Kitasatospora aburaviensis]|uniref:Sensor histidine kinase n=1 Tax=Kitasatospora aburaviensis TaxID=67265 RepID=A0ABW1F4V4_9ACTN
MRARTPAAVARIVAWLILLTAAVFLAEGLMLWLRHRPSFGPVCLAAIGLPAFAVTFARTVHDVVARGGARNRHLLDVAICTSVAFALLLLLGGAWGALPSLAACAAVVSLSARRAVWAATGILLVTALAGLLVGVPASVLIDVVVRSAVTVAVVGALGLLPLFTREIHDNRAELARMAVLEERLRFARDLHDVLGHGLSVVGMKLEVALLLLGSDPDRARTEIEQALGVSRESVSDLRSLVRGYRQPSLESELEGVRSVLRSAGITCRTDKVPPGVPQPLQDVAGWVVREGVTNVLRHSAATECRIKLRVDDGRLLVEVANDRARPTGTSDGNGLRGLRERLTDLSGELTAGPDGTGGFRLLAHAPLHHTASGPAVRDRATHERTAQREPA